MLIGIFRILWVKFCFIHQASDLERCFSWRLSPLRNIARLVHQFLSHSDRRSKNISVEIQLFWVSFLLFIYPTNFFLCSQLMIWISTLKVLFWFLEQRTVRSSMLLFKCCTSSLIRRHAVFTVLFKIMLKLIFYFLCNTWTTASDAIYKDMTIYIIFVSYFSGFLIIQSLLQGGLIELFRFF